MERALRPWITVGVALTGASLIAITPATQSLPDVQHRLVQLTTTEAGDINFPEVDYNDFIANTTANWNGLMDLYDHTTAIYSLPDAVYTQGLPQVASDLSTELQELAKYSAELSAYDAAVAAQNGELNPGTLPPIPTFPDLYNDPVLNPVSALTLLLQNGISSGFGSNALEAGWTGIYQNMLPSINDITTQSNNIFTQVENVFTGGTFSESAVQADLTTIETDLTHIGNFLSLAPTTLLNDYLNGYPVVSAAQDPLVTTIPTISDAYTLNAPFTASDNVGTTPEFGLLTNPDAVFTTDASGFGDGTSSTFLGTAPLETGTLAALLQSEQTLSDELLTETSTIAGSGVTAPADTGTLTLIGPDSITVDLNLSDIPVVGSAISLINETIIPFLNTTLTGVISTTNDAITGLDSTITSIVNPILSIYNDCVNDTICDGILDGFSKIITGSDAPSASDITSSELIPQISLTIPTIGTIPTTVPNSFDLPDSTDPGVPAYTYDLAQNEMAILSSLSSLAAPVTGTDSSADIGNFLATDPIMNLGTDFDGFMNSIFSPLLTFDTSLPLQWANVLAESLDGLFTAP